jgi:hypothetical protein
MVYWMWRSKIQSSRASRTAQRVTKEEQKGTCAFGGLGLCGDEQSSRSSRTAGEKDDV